MIGDSPKAQTEAFPAEPAARAEVERLVSRHVGRTWSILHTESRAE